jgi:hypothetical protein
MTALRNCRVKFCRSCTASAKTDLSDVEETGILALYSVVDLCYICANNIRVKLLQISYVLFMFATPESEFREPLIVK